MSNPISVNITGAANPSGTYKNIVLKNSFSFAEQLTEENAIYHVKWNYDLEGASVTMPANAILKMEGGRIYNGTLVGQDTLLVCDTTKEAAFIDIEFEGIWKDTDLTTVNNEDLDFNSKGEIQFADKEYDENNYSGLGRVYLRKNITAPSTESKWLLYNTGTADILIYATGGKFYLPYVHKKKEKVIAVYSQTSYGTLQYPLEDSNIEDELGLSNSTQFLYFDDDDLSITMPNSTTVLASDVVSDNWPLDSYTDYKGKNVLTQSMLTQTNTIYHIQYDFDLNGESITIPEDCVLKFEGGSLSNGKIILSNNIKVINAISSDVLWQSHGVENVSFNLCTFNMSGFSEETPDDECQVIYADSVSKLCINQCTFNLGRYTGSIMLIYCDDVICTDNIINGGNEIETIDRDASGGIFITHSSNNVIIANNHIKNVFIGVSIQGISGSPSIINGKTCVIGNVITHCKGYGIITYKATYISNNCIIDGNYIEYVTGNYNNIATQPTNSLGGGIYINLCKRVTVTNNIVKNVAIYSSAQSALAPAGIALSAVQHCICSNNIIQEPNLQGIILAGDFIVAEGNTVEDAKLYPIEVRNGNGIIISSNSIKSPVNDANYHSASIYIHKRGLGFDEEEKNIENIVISSNYLIGRQFGIYLDSETTGMIKICNNIIDSFYKYGIVASDGDIEVTYNIIKSIISSTNGISVTGVANAVLDSNNISTQSNKIANDSTGVVDERIRNISRQAVDDLAFIPEENSGILVYNNNTKKLAVWDKEVYRWRELDGAIIPAHGTFIRRYGTTAQRPNVDNIYIGFVYFDTTIGSPIWYNGAKWIEFDGATAGANRAGSTTEIPPSSSIYVGFRYFDTDLGTDVVWAGSTRGWITNGGFTAALVRGELADRPTTSLTATDNGYQYYATDVHKVIYFDYNGGTPQWYYADGTIVS